MRRWTAFVLLPGLLAGVVLLDARAAAAPASAATPVPHGTVTLIAERESFSPGHPFELGLHFRLENGWHIYWVNPGDSGQPPRVDWNLPAGITAGEIEWPAPQRIGDANIMDFGYNGEVTLLVPMRVAASLPTQPAQIRGNLRVLVCREICVPGKAALALTLPVKSGAAPPDPQTEPLFAAARSLLPKPAPGAWKFRVNGTNNNFLLHADLGHPFAQATFFPLEESQIDNAAPQTVKSWAHGFEMTLKKSDQLLKPIAELKGILVLPSHQAFTIEAPVALAGSAK